MRVKVRKKPAPAVECEERKSTSLRSRIEEYGIPSTVIVDKPAEEAHLLDTSGMTNNIQILADVCRKASSLTAIGSL